MFAFFTFFLVILSFLLSVVIGPTALVNNLKHIVQRQPKYKVQLSPANSNKINIFKWLWMEGDYADYIDSYYKATIDDNDMITAGCFTGNITQFEARINYPSSTLTRTPISVKYYTEKLTEFKQHIQHKADRTERQAKESQS